MSKFSSSNILDKLQTYSEKFHSALDDFSNAYINYKLYPQYEEHKNTYLNYKGVIESLQADVFIATNEIQKNIEMITESTKDLNSKINSAKKNNTNLQKHLNDVMNDSNGSHLLIKQTKSLYIQKYILNITLFIGSIMLLFTMFKVYQKKTNTMQIQ
uniref:Uncharacterized protein n=1 Tax=viral metagenome TaxID=1070528 RepID=A0A6C0D6M4_9ZZZZ